MVDGVRPGRIGGFSPVAGEGSAETGGSFKVDMGAGAVTQSARLSGSSAIGFESMLALQAVDEDQERNRSARKRGLAMVAALTDLQRAMLGAEDPRRLGAEPSTRTEIIEKGPIARRARIIKTGPGRC